MKKNYNLRFFEFAWAALEFAARPFETAIRHK